MRPQPAERVPAWGPLRNPLFARLWWAWLIANLCTWMSDVAAAWLMTQLTDSKLLVSLVQTAATLPVLLLAMPSGAIADMVDRRHALLAAQVWAAAVAATVTGLAFGGQLSAPLLLVLVFAGSMAMALRWPVFSAVLPEVVSHAELPQAMALHGIAVNITRIVGPLVAGVVVATWSSKWVFALSAALSVVTVTMLWRWQYKPAARTTPSEGFLNAMRSGWTFARASAPFRAVLARTTAFFLAATALVALLPLLALLMHTTNSGRTYAILLAALGCGAVTIGFFMQTLRARWTPQVIVTGCSVLMAATMEAVALTTEPWIGAVAMFVAGCSWLGAGNTLSIAAQRCLPNHVRARGMSFFLMAVVAGGACGATLFGALAEGLGVRGAIHALAALTLALGGVTHKLWQVRAE